VIEREAEDGELEADRVTLEKVTPATRDPHSSRDVDDVEPLPERDVVLRRKAEGGALAPRADLPVLGVVLANRDPRQRYRRQQQLHRAPLTVYPRQLVFPPPQLAGQLLHLRDGPLLLLARHRRHRLADLVPPGAHRLHERQELAPLRVDAEEREHVDRDPLLPGRVLVRVGSGSEIVEVDHGQRV
jgi:hypothetical protein